VNTRNDIINNSPALETKRKYVIRALARYWPQGHETLEQLCIPAAPDVQTEFLPPRMEMIELPEWAAEIGVEGALFVPAHCIIGTQRPLWKQADWFTAAFWYLNGTAEREFEKQNGSIHSYASHLKGWDKRIWERAWVNRIALFLRKWASQDKSQTEEEIFGILPEPEIIVTHDVDAVKKTIAIRFKQTAFHLFNCLRLAANGSLASATKKLIQAFRFLFSYEDYWCFEKITQLERHYGLKSCFNFYAGPGALQRSLKQRLFDPAYDIFEPRISNQVKKLYHDGWQVGLHQSFDTWNNLEMMRAEKARLEKSLGQVVTNCRQHWLRFSWENTWKAQHDAGLRLDTTLGFNDRPGFRNGSALQFHPWDPAKKKEMELFATPLVLMDSHLYDYQVLNKEIRSTQMKYWLDEIRAVNGTATIVWHQQVMNNDYDWHEGFSDLLKILTTDN